MKYGHLHRLVDQMHTNTLSLVCFTEKYRTQLTLTSFILKAFKSWAELLLIIHL